MSCDETSWLEELLGFSIKPSHGGKPVATPKRILESNDGFLDYSSKTHVLSNMFEIAVGKRQRFRKTPTLAA